MESTSRFFAFAILLLTSYGSSAQKFRLKSNADGSFLLVPANATVGSDNLLVDLKNLAPIPVKGSTQEPPGTNSQTPQMIISKLVRKWIKVKLVTAIYIYVCVDQNSVYITI